MGIIGVRATSKSYRTGQLPPSVQTSDALSVSVSASHIPDDTGGTAKIKAGDKAFRCDENVRSPSFSLIIHSYIYYNPQYQKHCSFGPKLTPEIRRRIGSIH